MLCQPPATIFNPPNNGLCDPVDQGDGCERRRSERERDREPKLAADENRIILSTPLLLPIFKIPPLFEKPDPATPINYYLRPDFSPPLGLKTKPSYGD
jgi:hypothetical protein